VVLVPAASGPQFDFDARKGRKARERSCACSDPKKIKRQSASHIRGRQWEGNANKRPKKSKGYHPGHGAHGIDYYFVTAAHRRCHRQQRPERKERGGFCLVSKFFSKFHYAKRRFPITSKCR
jgi:hypothetical protein